MKQRKHNRKTKARVEKKIESHMLHEIMNDYYELEEALEDRNDGDD